MSCKFKTASRNPISKLYKLPDQVPMKNYHALWYIPNIIIIFINLL